MQFRFGIPEVNQSANGPLFNSNEFHQFMRSGVRYTYSAPHDYQSNGFAENFVDVKL